MPIRLMLICVLAASTTLADDSAPSAEDVFQQRIMPIFRSPNPSSCVQCHLSSVDLKDYILPSSDQTFLALSKQGLIDAAAPGESKILELIRMGEKDRDERAVRIHKKVREQELAAFRSWIESCCKDPKLTSRKADTPQVGPKQPLAIVRHARRSRVMDSFERNVWSQRMRCFPCHTPHEIDADNPQHKKAAANREKMVAKFGRLMDLFQETPEKTLQHMINRSRKTRADRLPMLNLESPELSLLVLKPTSKLPARDENKEFAKPSAVVPVSHMGGLKMHVDDQSYKAILTWIHDYARVVEGEYQSVDDLPADNWYPTKQVLRIKGTPDDWQPMSRVQVFVFDWNTDREEWNSEAVAFTQSLVTPRKMLNGPLTLLASDHATISTYEDQTSDTEAKRLPAGKYKLRAYVDNGKRLEADPTVLLGEDDFVGETVVEAQWRDGFKLAELVEGSLFE